MKDLKNNFYGFALIALDYKPKKMKAFMSRFNSDKLEQLKENVIIECNKILKYSLNEDDKKKAVVIIKAIKLQNLANFYYRRGDKFNQIEHLENESLKHEPPSMINSNEIEAYTKRIRLRELPYNSFQINNHTYELLLYLAKVYNHKNTKVGFVNLMYFMKNDYKPEGNTKLFNFKREEFKEFIKKEFNVTISKFQKSDKYESRDIDILNGLVERFP